MAIIIKNEEQIEGIKKSSKLAAQALKYSEKLVEPGVSTASIDKKIEEFIRDNGAIPAPLNYHGFPKATCISPNDVICHGIPTTNVILNEGDIVNIDITTILDGYFGDTSKMFFVGQVSEEAKKLVAVAKESLEIGINQVFTGNRFGNIGFQINQFVKKQGYSVVHQFSGHGVGLEFHEAPVVNHKAKRNSGAKMYPGMVFTIEPMINQGKARAIIDKYDKWTARTIDGKLSAQFEHTILVTQTGYEILTIT